MVHFWWTFGGLLVDFLWTFGGLLAGFWWTFGCPLADFGGIPAHFWRTFGGLLADLWRTVGTWHVGVRRRCTRGRACNGARGRQGRCHGDHHGVRDHPPLRRALGRAWSPNKSAVSQRRTKPRLAKRRVPPCVWSEGVLATKTRPRCPREAQNPGGRNAVCQPAFGPRGLWATQTSPRCPREGQNPGWRNAVCQTAFGPRALGALITPVRSPE